MKNYKEIIANRIDLFLERQLSIDKNGQWKKIKRIPLTKIWYHVRYDQSVFHWLIWNDKKHRYISKGSKSIAFLKHKNTSYLFN